MAYRPRRPLRIQAGLAMRDIVRPGSPAYEPPHAAARLREREGEPIPYAEDELMRDLAAAERATPRCATLGSRPEPSPWSGRRSGGRRGQTILFREAAAPGAEYRPQDRATKRTTRHGGGEMSSEENKAVVRRFLEEGVAQGHLDVFDHLCAPDIVNHAAAPERRHGIDGIKDVIGFSRRAQPDQEWVSRTMIAEGDLVVVHGIREGTWQAEHFRGIPTPAGRRVAVELVHIFRLVGGKIVEHWAVRDDLGMMQQLGALPPRV